MQRVQASDPEACSAAQEPVPPGEPNLSSGTKEGVAAPEVLGYLHRGPPWARPGLVQLAGVLRWQPGLAHVHVAAAAV